MCTHPILKKLMLVLNALEKWFKDILSLPKDYLSNHTKVGGTLGYKPFIKDYSEKDHFDWLTMSFLRRVHALHLNHNNNIVVTALRHWLSRHGCVELNAVLLGDELTSVQVVYEELGCGEQKWSQLKMCIADLMTHHRVQSSIPTAYWLPGGQSW